MNMREKHQWSLYGRLVCGNVCILHPFVPAGIHRGSDLIGRRAVYWLLYFTALFA